jgi:organic radical activating enzyme
MIPTLALDKSCNLKGKQKLFYFFLDQTSSCCRSYPEILDPSKKLENYFELWQQESQQLDQGLEITSCDPCWKQERKGEISHRLQFGGDPSDVIELWFSNACNQMCSYCSPQFSSAWQESIQLLGMFENVSQTAKNNLLTIESSTKHTDQWLDQIKIYISQRPDNSVTLKLLGGEPLMQIANLQSLLQFQSKKIKTIKINTNLNPPNNKFLLWLLQNIDTKKVQMTVSLDASLGYNHVPRSGFDQEKFAVNLQLLIDHGVDFEFSAVISVLNVFDLPNYVSWIKQNKFKCNFLTLNQPDCLSASFVPQRFLQPLIAQFGNDAPPELFSELIKIEKPEVGLKLFEQYNYLKQYFDRTNTKVKDTVFEPYWNWLKERHENSIGI